jgi:PPOX class probable F420-dependent enzyme
MDGFEARVRFTGARVGHLATVSPDGRPHVVPLVFAVEGDVIYWAVDEKPKRSRRLKRLENLRANPNAEVVADRYDEDWSALWWIRARGRARILEDDEEVAVAAGALAGKYARYAERPPGGPFVAIDVEAWSWWSSTEPGSDD